MFRVAIPIVVSLALLLAGCGSDNDDADQGSSSPTSHVDESTATSPSPSLSATTAASPTAPPAASPSPSPNTAIEDAPYAVVAEWGEPALLIEPIDVAVAPDGSLIVSDFLRHQVIVIAPDGETLSRIEINSFPGPIAVDGDGAIYLRSSEEPALIKVDNDGNLLATLDFGTPERHFRPLGLAATVDGHLYVTSSDGRSGSGTPPSFRGVYVYEPSGERIAEWAAPLAYHPHAIAVSPDGSVYVGATEKAADQQDIEDILIRIEPDTYSPNAWIETHIPLPDGLRINGLAIAPDGAIVIVEAGGPQPEDAEFTRVLRLNDTGEIESEWATELHGSGSLSATLGNAIGPDGSIYLADSRNQRIMQYDSSGNLLEVFTGREPGTFGIPVDIETGPDGQVYVIDPATHQVQWFTPEGEVVGSIPIPGLYRGYNAAEKPGLAVAEDGTIWISTPLPPRVTALSSDGSIIHEWGTFTIERPSGGELWFAPASITLTGEQTILVSNNHEQVLLEFSLDGQLLSEWVLPERASVRNLTVATAGTSAYALIPITDTIGNEVAFEIHQLLDDGTTTHLVSIPTDTGTERPAFFSDLAIDGNGTFYTTDLLNRQVIIIDPETDAVQALPIDGVSDRPGWPISVAIDDADRLYVANAELQKITAYERERE